MQKLFDAGAHVNCRYHPPLNYACKLGDLKIIRLLLTQGAKVVADESDQGPLLSLLGSHESEETLIEITHLLLSHGARLDATNYRGETALLCACKANLMQLAEVLISEDVSGATLSIADREGLVPLHVLSVYGSLEKGRLAPVRLPRYKRVCEFTSTQYMDRNAKFALNSITAMQPYEKLTFDEIRLMEWRAPKLSYPDFATLLKSKPSLPATAPIGKSLAASSMADSINLSTSTTGQTGQATASPQGNNYSSPSATLPSIVPTAANQGATQPNAPNPNPYPPSITNFQQPVKSLFPPLKNQVDLIKHICALPPFEEVSPDEIRFYDLDRIKPSSLLELDAALPAGLKKSASQSANGDAASFTPPKKDSIFDPTPIPSGATSPFAFLAPLSSNIAADFAAMTPMFPFPNPSSGFVASTNTPTSTSTSSSTSEVSAQSPKSEEQLKNKMTRQLLDEWGKAEPHYTDGELVYFGKKRPFMFTATGASDFGAAAQTLERAFAFGASSSPVAMFGTNSASSPTIAKPLFGAAETNVGLGLAPTVKSALASPTKAGGTND
jgi:hypothetical protein